MIASPRHLPAVAILLLAIVILGPATLAQAGVEHEADRPVTQPPPTQSPDHPAERTAQDRMISAAAIGSIVLVAVAGTYIYVLIRRGL